MSGLSANEAAVLTQVASFPNLTQKRRMQLLSRSSRRAQEIGRIIVKGERPADPAEYRKVAKKFARWATENER
jgi:cytochrome c556